MTAAFAPIKSSVCNPGLTKNKYATIQTCVGWRVGFLFCSRVLCTFVEIQPCGASACVETQPGSRSKTLACCIRKISTHTLLHARDVLWFFIYTGPGKIPWNLKKNFEIGRTASNFPAVVPVKDDQNGNELEQREIERFSCSKHFSQIGHS